MGYWVKVDGLTYEFETLDGYRDRFISADFVAVVAQSETQEILFKSERVG